MFLVFFILFSACATKPIIFDTDLLIYSNDEIEVDYRIGYSIYFLKIMNLTDKEIIIDAERISVISPQSEAKNLNIETNDRSIPPHSYVVYEGDQKTFFKTDIDSQFSFQSKKPRTGNDNWRFLDSNIGSVIRIYIPYSVDGLERSADIKIPLPYLKDQ